MNDRHLLIIRDDQGGRKVFLDASIYLIGRSSDCHIQISSKFVSRCHATLMLLPLGRHDSCYRIIDGDLKDGIGSRNGLFVNDRRVKMHSLQNQDKIVFGYQVTAVYYRLQDSLSENSQVAEAWENFPTVWVDRYQKMMTTRQEQSQ